MPANQDYLALDDHGLLEQCDVQTYRSSGPGGQHRNKVSSAVRLRHLPTGITVHGDQSRSQHENKRLALKRLRMEIACRLRCPLDRQAPPPAAIGECTQPAGPSPAGRTVRMAVSTKSPRFWPVAAYLLDVLEAFEGRLAPAAGHVGVTTSNLGSILKSDRRLLGAAQAIRARHGQKPLQ